MEEFLFSYEFQNFVVHSYQFELLRKKLESTKKWSFYWLKIFDPINLEPY